MHTHPAKQWAAVTTQELSTRTPPHIRPPSSWRLTSQGQLPGVAGEPPTILERGCVMFCTVDNLWPHTAAGTQRHWWSKKQKHNLFVHKHWILELLYWRHWQRQKGNLYECIFVNTCIPSPCTCVCVAGSRFCIVLSRLHWRTRALQLSPMILMQLSLSSSPGGQRCW